MTMLDDEIAIRSLLEARALATRDKDAGAAAEPLAGDIVNYDIAPPLEQRGARTIADGLREWFDSWDGPVGLELGDLTVRAEGGIAFAYGLVHLTGKRADGSRTDVWTRSTVCLERRGGEWKIVHEHGSIPMYMDGSEKAATDLKPEPNYVA